MKKGGRRSQGLLSKATSVLALGIGLSPAIISLSSSMENGFQAKATIQNLAQAYGINPDGTFNFTQAVKNTAGPVILAIVFKKGISYLTRVAKLKI